MKREQFEKALKTATEDLPKHPDIIRGTIGKTVLEIIEQGRQVSESSIIEALEAQAAGNGVRATAAKEAVTVICMTQASSDH